MKFATALLIGAAAAKVSDEVEIEFLKFISDHGRSYATTEEYKFRLGIFAEKFEFIQRHNSENSDDHVVGVNKFMDLTDHEYSKYLGLKKNLNHVKKNSTTLNIEVADSIDWRAKGAVNPVQNQGQCGSCWSFSAVGALEGAYAISTGNLLKFSEQQLVDCSTSFGNAGCNGGWMDQAFEYWEGTKAVLESQYAYTAHDDTCNTSVVTADGVTLVASYHDVTENSPSALVAALNVGPVAVAVNAGSLGFQLYSSGILKRFCGTNLDHGIVAVGYGSDNGTDYYIVRNSWGSSWGEQGYVRILRTADEGKPGVCGIQMAASYPLL
jgi:C1A family cysteine protease